MVKNKSKIINQSIFNYKFIRKKIYKHLLHVLET